MLSFHERLPAPVLSRTQWEAHPHFPDQVLLVRSHEAFRRVSEELMVAARDGTKRLAVAGLVFDHWLSAMGGHEHYEEHKLYPYLEHRYDVSLERLRTGHKAIHVHEQLVRSELQRTRSRLPAPALHHAFAEFDRVLKQHLDEEEGLVVPMLLELEPREFLRYTALPIEALVRG